jgi:hypothetical protein
MSDKIKRAARQRQRETGEAYTTARRRVIAEHEARQTAALPLPEALPACRECGSGPEAAAQHYLHSQAGAQQ